jgi:hypothetical protein
LTNSAQAQTIIGGVSSPGTKVGFTTSMFEIEYGQHGVKTRLKSKTWLLRPEKVYGQFYGLHVVIGRPLMLDPNLLLIW